MRNVTNSTCDWDVLNPFLLFSTEQYNLHTRTIVCDSFSDDQFTRGFCYGLQGIGMAFAYLVFFCSCYNLFFIYRGRIRRTINIFKLNNSPSPQLRSDINTCEILILLSSIIQFLDAINQIWFFKGREYYFSPILYYSNSNPPLYPEACLDNTSIYSETVIKLAAAFWMIYKSILFGIQTAAGMATTDYMKVRTKENYLSKYTKWGVSVGSILFILFAAILYSYFESDDCFSFGIYFPIFSLPSCTWWICLCVFYSLLMYDRLITFNSFQLQEKELANKHDQNLLIGALDDFKGEITQEVIQKELEKIFPNDVEYTDSLAKKITSVYEENYKERLFTLPEVAKNLRNSAEPQGFPTSSSYVRFLLMMHMLQVVSVILGIISWYNFDSQGEPVYLTVIFHFIGLLVYQFQALCNASFHSLRLFEGLCGPLFQRWQEKNAL